VPWPPPGGASPGTRRWPTESSGLPAAALGARRRGPRGACLVLLDGSLEGLKTLHGVYHKSSTTHEREIFGNDHTAKLSALCIMVRGSREGKRQGGRGARGWFWSSGFGGRTTRVEKEPKDSWGWRCAFHIATGAPGCSPAPAPSPAPGRLRQTPLWLGVPPSHSCTPHNPPTHTHRAESREIHSGDTHAPSPAPGTAGPAPSDWECHPATAAQRVPQPPTTHTHREPSTGTQISGAATHAPNSQSGKNWASSVWFGVPPKGGTGPGTDLVRVGPKGGTEPGTDLVRVGPKGQGRD